jgi:GntR family transcriptional regulator
MSLRTSPLRRHDERKWNVDRSSPLPLYVQIRHRLLSLVAQWSRSEGRFYSDDELCRYFGVSRVTVRQAVAELVNEGFLTRVRGSGTYVALKKIEEKFTPPMDIRSQWAALGLPMSVSVLAFERRAAPAHVAAMLGRREGAEVLYVKRIRSTSNVPIAIDHRYIPAEHVPHLRKADASASILHKLWETIEFSHSELQIEGSLAGEEEQALLHMPKGDPVLVRHLVYFDRQGRPVLAGHSIHRADLMRYSLRVELSRASADADDPDAPRAGKERAVRIAAEVRTELPRRKGAKKGRTARD